MNNLGCCLFYESLDSPFSRVLSGYVPGSRYSGQEAYGALAAFIILRLEWKLFIILFNIFFR